MGDQREDRGGVEEGPLEQIQQGEGEQPARPPTLPLQIEVLRRK